MKSVMPGVCLLAVISYGQQQPQDPLCAGPPPPPPRTMDNNGERSAESIAWEAAMATWAPCPFAATAAAGLPGAISARRLAHRPPRSARKEFDAGMNSLRKRRDSGAQEHFAKAAQLDPGFVEAQVHLGELEAKAGQTSLALETFLRVAALEPNDAGFQSNVAWTLLMLRRSAEAEPYARRAIRLSPSFIDAHFALGVALVDQDRFTPEAVAALRVAAAKHPWARDLLSQVEARLSAATP